MSFSIKALGSISNYALKVFNQIPFLREPEMIFVDFARPKEIEEVNANSGLIHSKCDSLLKEIGKSSGIDSQKPGNVS